MNLIDHILINYPLTVFNSFALLMLSSVLLVGLVEGRRQEQVFNELKKTKDSETTNRYEI